MPDPPTILNKIDEKFAPTSTPNTPLPPPPPPPAPLKKKYVCKNKNKTQAKIIECLN